MVLDPLNGTLIRNFDRLQSEYADAWSIETGLAAGAPVYGDREVTYTAVPDALVSEYPFEVTIAISEPLSSTS